MIRNLLTQIRGKVVSQGNPVSAVNVSEISAGGAVVARTQTDSNGLFKLTVSGPNAVIKFSHVGFEDIIMTAKDVPASVDLFIETTLLNEVVIHTGSTAATEPQNNSFGWGAVLGTVAAIYITFKIFQKKPKKVTL